MIIVKMKIWILASLVLFVLAGCGGAANYYMLSGSKPIDLRQNKRLATIGVERVRLPEYMKQGKIAIQLSPTQISYSDSDNWAEDMESSLTKELIATIQKSFNHPNVYAYPWDLSKQAGIKIKVIIHKFIAYGDYVYLDASWEISDLKRDKQHAKLFSTKVPTDKSMNSVVASMNAAFEQLSERIVRDIAS
ncbi:MAG: PqiC family protein [Campylobacterota bacterium]|nr:PqiC family protein [Campylobacterota bacterium]